LTRPTQIHSTFSIRDEAVKKSVARRSDKKHHG